MREATVASDRWTSRFRDARHAEEKPDKRCRQAHDAELFDSRCPYCDQSLERSSLSISSLLVGGIRQLGFALLMIAFGIVRCLRFVAALLLCLIGFIGSCCRALGNQIAHQNDRQFLKKL